MERIISPSPYQQALFDFIEKGQGHAVVRATAGAGKSTTLLEATHYLPRGMQAGFVAFNNEVADALAARLPRGVAAKTVHSLGFQLLREGLAKSKDQFEVQPDKSSGLARQVLSKDDRSAVWSTKVQRQAQQYMTQLARYIRLDLVLPEGLADLLKRYALITPETGVMAFRETVHELVWQLIDLGFSACEKGKIDYEDMLFYPVVRGFGLARAFDYLFVDEAQDLSQAGLYMILRSIKPEGRLVLVGDEAQAIYGFAGADVAVIERIIQQIQPKVFYLSRTYRCPRSHVRLARQFSSHIEAAPDAEEGEIVLLDETSYAEKVRPGDLVLCRTTEPLLRAAFQVMREGTPAQVLGADVAERLKRDAHAGLPKDLAGWQEALEAYELRELQVIQSSSQEEAIRAALLSRRVDELASLRALLEGMEPEALTSLKVLDEQIGALFTPRLAATFSTVHRAKGKEAQRVFVLYPHLMPLANALGEVDEAGEPAVQFVAVTRSRESLFFVDSLDAPDTQKWWHVAAATA